MALQIGTTYTLERHGVRAVINDPDDPDYIGRLDPEAGITGLDGAEIRESADELVEADGGVHGDFFAGRRPVTLSGWIFPDPLVEANRRQDRLLYVTDALRDDVTLRWTEEGAVEKLLRLRAQQRTRITGRRPKRFLCALVSADSRIYSATEQQAVVPALGAAALGGLRWPLTWPLDFSGGQPDLGAGVIVNEGTKSTPPWMRLDGPITNPVIANESTGEELRLTYTLPAGQWIELDASDHSILLNGQTDIYSALNFAASQWWDLLPALEVGGNDIKLRAAEYANPAALTVRWRHAWN